MATMATMATQYPLENAQPGERFSYVFVPADSNLPLEARTESAEGGLEDDKLSKSLRAGSELGPNIDITAVRQLTRPYVRPRVKTWLLRHNLILCVIECSHIDVFSMVFASRWHKLCRFTELD